LSRPVPAVEELDEDESMVEPAPAVELPDDPGDDPAEPDAVPLVAGFMAGEPEVVDPDPVANGRSVEPDDVEVWARAGAATSVVINKQAAICVLIMELVSSSVEVS